MKTWNWVLAGVLALGASAYGAPVLYYAALSGANENPSVPSPGTGQAWVTIDTMAHTLRVQVMYSDLLANVTAAHIHCCIAPPGNVGVATQTPTFTGFPVGTSGMYDMTFDTTMASSFNASFVTANGGVAGAEAALATGLASGFAYLNIHSAAFGGGEIRGFLVAVPEPATFALVGLALAGTVILRRRRR